MANKTFEQYFIDRGALVGSPASVGDEILVLRSNTVFRAKAVDNRSLLYMSGNATPTAISVVDAWQPIGGTLSQSYLSASFTLASNQLTYVGPDQAVPAFFTVHASLFKASPSNTQDYEIGVFANTVLLDNPIRVTVPEDTYVALTVTASHALSTGDVIDVRIRDRTAAESVTITDMQFVGH